MVVRGSDLDPDSGYPDLGISWVSSLALDKFWDCAFVKPRPLPSKSFAICHSSVILPFDALCQSFSTHGTSRKALKLSRLIINYLRRDFIIKTSNKIAQSV
jgi:hypothetical protein